MHIRIRTALMLVGCGLACESSAQEYCVTCTDPPATYRCSIASEVGTVVPPSRGQLLCITELAHTGNHASCSVGRTMPEPCTGQPRTVMFTNAAEEALPPIGVQPEPAVSEPPALADGEPPPAPDEAPPQTVEELAKQTVEASGKGLKKAGEAVSDGAKSTGKAVGNAVSKTWNCLTSLFSDC